MCFVSVVGPMRVGHEPQMSVCNTLNPSTELVSGVRVGHFGGETEAVRYAELRVRCAIPGAPMFGGPMLGGPMFGSPMRAKLSGCTCGSQFRANDRE